jgi:hypothetical protein
VIVPKKVQPGEAPKFRLCIDYRWLNEQTKKDAHPLPKIADILPSLSDAKYFTSFDLASSYHQVPMNPADVEKTAFSTPYGHYQYKSMPFGLTNAPATFQRLMSSVFGDLLGKELLAYLDDLVIFSADFESHLASIDKVLALLEKAKLKCQPSKCQIFRSSLTYLGHTISPEGVSPRPESWMCFAIGPSQRMGLLC